MQDSKPVERLILPITSAFTMYGMSVGASKQPRRVALCSDNACKDASTGNTYPFRRSSKLYHSSIICRIQPERMMDPEHQRYIPGTGVAVADAVIGSGVGEASTVEAGSSVADDVAGVEAGTGTVFVVAAVAGKVAFNYFNAGLKASYNTLQLLVMHGSLSGSEAFMKAIMRIAGVQHCRVRK